MILGQAAGFGRPSDLRQMVESRSFAGAAAELKLSKAGLVRLAAPMSFDSAQHRAAAAGIPGRLSGVVDRSPRRLRRLRQYHVLSGLAVGENRAARSARSRPASVNASRRDVRLMRRAARRVSDAMVDLIGEGFDAAKRCQTSVRDIAWKAQVRLCTRYRRMLARRKKKPVVITAIARELVGFMWAIAYQVEPKQAAG
jgi:hypothetical protein